MERYYQKTVKGCIYCPNFKCFRNSFGNDVLLCRFLEKPIICTGNAKEETKTLKDWFENMCILEKTA